MWWGQASPGASSSMVRGYISDRGANITQSEKTFYYDDSKPIQYSTIFKNFNDWIYCSISSIVLWSTTNLLLLFFSLFVTETFLSLFLFEFFLRKLYLSTSTRNRCATIQYIDVFGPRWGRLWESADWTVYANTAYHIYRILLIAILHINY